MSKQGSSKKRGMRNVVSFNNSLVTRTCIIDSFTTGLSALMRQNIAESGMAANQEPGAIGWEIIPEASTHDDPMDVDPHLDEWEDIFEEIMGPKGKAVAGLQTVISCTLFPPTFPHLYVIML